MKRLLFLVAMSLMTVAATAQQKDWAKFGRFVEANKSVVESPDAVFMGNSITEQWAEFDPEFFQKNNFTSLSCCSQRRRNSGKTTTAHKNITTIGDFCFKLFFNYHSEHLYCL